MWNRKRLLVVAAVLIAAIAYFWPRENFVLATIDRVVFAIVAASGISSNLARGVVIITTIPFFWAIAEYTKKRWFGEGPPSASLKLYTDKHGLIIVGYCAVYFLVLYGVSRESLSQKWCADTPEGIRVFDDPGTDPLYGFALQRCSADQIRELRRANIGVPTRVPLSTAATLEFFDGATGRPKVWFAKGPSGELELFDRPGTHPQTQATLQPVNAAAVRQILEEAGRLKDQTVRQSQAEAAARRDADEARRKDEAVSASAAAARRAEAEAKEEKDREAAYVASLVNDLSRFRGQTVVLVATAEGQVDGPATQALSEKTGGTSGLFKPAFVSQGVHAQLMSGDLATADRLGLTSRQGLLVLGTSSVKHVTNNVAGEDVVKASADLRFWLLKDGRATTVTADGVATAFDIADARRNALEAAVSKAVPKIRQW